MGNLSKPPRRIPCERNRSNCKPNGYAFGGDVVVKREDRRGPEGQPLQPEEEQEEELLCSPPVWQTLKPQDRKDLACFPASQGPPVGA